MTEDARIVADHIRQHLRLSLIPLSLLTVEDVLFILLEHLDDFHEYNSSKARAVAEDVLQTWLEENKVNWH